MVRGYPSSPLLQALRKEHALLIGGYPPSIPWLRAGSARCCVGGPPPPPSTGYMLGERAAWLRCPPLSPVCAREARAAVWGVPPPPPSPGYGLGVSIAWLR